MIGSENPVALSELDSEAVNEIKNNETIEIGSKSQGLSASLDSAYANVKLKINVENLIEEIMVKRHKIFVFEGFGNRKHLKSILKRHKYLREDLKKDLKSALSVLKNKDRVIITDKYSDEEFKRVCKDNPEKEVYWISKTSRDKDLILQKVYNPNFYISRKFKNNKKCAILETDFIEMLNHEKAVILAGDPGEGKTTTLVKMIEGQSIRENYWAVLVDLKEFLKKSKNAVIADLVDYLVNQHEKSVINLLSKFAINEELAISLCIFFDGFDEVFDESDRMKIISLLKVLKEETKVKFLITTDLQSKQILENSLSIIATRFEPLDDEEKEEFVKTYLQIRLDAVLDRSFDERDPYLFYAKKFLEAVESTSKTRFMGVPLQLYLMLEVAVEHFIEWVDKSHKTNFINYVEFQNPDFSYIGKSMLEIFSKFIHQKCECPKTTEMHDVESPCDRFNMEVANFLTPGLNENISFEKCMPCGIINNQKGDYTFIHSTFREYYIAKLCMTSLKQNEKEITDMIVKCVTHLCAQMEENERKKRLDSITVYISKAFMMEIDERRRKEQLEYIVQYTRRLPKNKNGGKNEADIAINCIEKLLKKLAKNRNMLDFVFGTVLRSQNYRIVRCFLNDMFLELTEKKITIPSKTYEYFERALRILNRDQMACAIQEGHAHIFEFFIVVLKENIFSMTCRFDESPLKYSCRCNRKDAVELVLRQTDYMFPAEFFDVLRKTGKSGETCLHLAALYNNSDIVNLILEKVTKICSNKEQIHEFLSVRDIYGNTPLHLSASCLGQYFSILTQESMRNSDLSAAYEEYGYAFPEIPYDLLAKNLPLHDKSPAEDKIFLKFFKKFVEDNKGQLKPNACNVFKLIISEVQENDREMITSLNSFGNNVLDYAAANKDSELIKLISKETSTFELLKQTSFCPIFAAMTNDDLNTFQFVLESIPPKNIYETITEIRFNIFHLNIQKGKTNFVRVILNRIKEMASWLLSDVLSFKANGSNALHLAAEKGHSLIVKLLIEYAKVEDGFLYEYLISVNENNENALHIAVRENQVQLEIAKLLLDAIPADKISEIILLTNDRTFNVLHMAAMNESSDLVKLILEKLKTIPPENVATVLLSRQNQNLDALELAISRNNVAAVDALLQFPFQWEYKYVNPNEKYTSVIREYHKLVRSISHKYPHKLYRIFGPDNRLIKTIICESDITGNIILIKCIFRILSSFKEDCYSISKN